MGRRKSATSRSNPKPEGTQGPSSAGSARRQRQVASAATAGARGISLPDLPAPWLEALVQHHLTPAERLALFHTSKGLATAVLQQADQTGLCLIGEQPSQRKQARQVLQARQALLQQLCSHARELHVTLRDGIPALWASLPKQSITHLTLAGRGLLSAQQLRRALQLQTCPQLRTLAVHAGMEFSMSAREQANLERAPAAWLPPTLHRLELLAEWHAPEVVFPLLYNLSHQLTEVWLQGDLQDGLMECIVELPQLQVVTARKPNLQGKAVGPAGPLPVPPREQWQLAAGHTWQQLVFHGPLLHDLHCLLKLPLHSIQELVLHGGLDAGYDLQAVQAGVHELARCPRVVCIPQERHLMTGLADTMDSHVFILTGCLTAELITLCSRHLSVGLDMDLMPVHVPPGQADRCPDGHRWQGGGLSGSSLLPGIASLPATLNTLLLTLLRPCYTHPHGPTNAATFWQQFVAALPHSVTRLVLTQGKGSHPHWMLGHAAVLARALAANEHPACITLLAIDEDYAGRYPCGAAGCTGIETVRREMEELAAAHPQQVRLQPAHME